MHEDKTFYKKIRNQHCMHKFMFYGSAISCDSAWVLQKTIFNYIYLYFITRNFYISDNIILNSWDTIIY